MTKYLILLVFIFNLAVIHDAQADGFPTLKGEPSFVPSQPAPPLTNYENHDVKRGRNYPEQPPTIPHNIDGYQVDKQANKCMACHARNRTEESKAPMISITHFVDREGQFLADITPRRYYCIQCHVPQQSGKPLIENKFQDIDSLLLKNKTKKTP